MEHGHLDPKTMPNKSDPYSMKRDNLTAKIVDTKRRLKQSFDQDLQE